MDNIENLLEKASKKDINIPPKIEYKIKYALKHKRKSNLGYNIKRLITVMASLIIVFIGGMSVYAAFGGTIAGKPVMEWIGIKFSDEYDNYKENVTEQEITYNETKVDLVSTVCDDAFTVLEFDVKLSKEDKEYLRLGESIITEEDLEEAKQRDENTNSNIMQGRNYEFLSSGKDTLNTVQLIFFGREVDQNGKKIYNSEGTYNIIIDGEKIWTRTLQTVTKISDYEYKVYQLFLLKDDELKGKENFKISLNNIVLGNTGERKKTENGMQIVNTPNNARYINIGGNFEVNVSKEKTLQDTKIIKPENVEVNYKNMTKKVEEVSITPLQIVVKVTTKVDNVSLNSLASVQNKNHIGIIDFKVYDNNNNELTSSSFETKRTITYENGKTEEWAPGDIGTYKDFKNATMQLTEYIIIEKKDNMNGIKIVPSERNDTTEGSNILGEMNISFE